MQKQLSDKRKCCLYKSIDKQSDQKLIQLCCDGQGPAWECLVRRYKRLVYHFPCDLGLSNQDCDEVFQETFLALYRSLDRLHEVDNLAYWLATVARRLSWRWKQTSNRHLGYDLETIGEIEDEDAELEIEINAKIQQSLVRKALKELDDRCRQLLTLLFYKYDSGEYDRVAEDAGIARGSIGPIRQRCLVKFKGKLAKYGINQKNVSKWLS